MSETPEMEDLWNRSKNYLGERFFPKILHLRYDRALIEKFRLSDPLHGRTLRDSYKAETFRGYGVLAGVYAAGNMAYRNFKGLGKRGLIAGLGLVLVYGGLSGAYLGNEYAKIKLRHQIPGKDDVREADAKLKEWLAETRGSS